MPCCPARDGTSAILYSPALRDAGEHAIKKTARQGKKMYRCALITGILHISGCYIIQSVVLQCGASQNYGENSLGHELAEDDIRCERYKIMPKSHWAMPEGEIGIHRFRFTCKQSGQCKSAWIKGIFCGKSKFLSWVQANVRCEAGGWAIVWNNEQNSAG